MAALITPGWGDRWSNFHDLVLLVNTGIRDRAAGVGQHDATHCHKYPLSKMQN